MALPRIGQLKAMQAMQAMHNDGSFQTNQSSNPISAKCQVSGIAKYRWQGKLHYQPNNSFTKHLCHGQFVNITMNVRPSE